ncbi:antitoxin MazE family protein [Aurantimonas sp. MSK8Z-1]|uniref:antitoxin MazE-like protein n=1 Tax=Mangrovibrevibacter kandeliae TaxID=2968473 RepID=UPI0021194E49|nr:antitoxin MazE-like protein [Aurantimonas sp. MSK8Z-1]MCW4113671.1 antitoxin MazE family protein [Aurantimonas sp. MSK8Z-1]
MGRPRELTQEQRDELLAKGYRPVEVWLPDIWSDGIWSQVEEDCRLIAESEERADADLWTEEALRETLRLIDEMEEKTR